MSVIKNLYILLFCFFLTGNVLCAQDDCSVILKQAEKLYDDGEIDSIPFLLEPCIKSGFSHDEKIKAFRLIILINLFKDNRTEAENYMLKLLRLEPEYSVNRSIEEPEYLTLFDSFQTSPLWACGLYGGVNFTDISTIEEFGVNNLNLQSTLKSSSKMSYLFGIKYSRFVYKKIDFVVSLQFAQNKYVSTKSLYDFAVINYQETQTRISMPLTVSYELNKKKIKPYIRAGLSIGYLLNSKATVIRSYSDNSHAEIKGTDVALKDFRNPVNVWILAGAGLKYKVKRANIVFDLKYNIGLFNQVKTKARYDNVELIYKYYYIDNDFRINNFAVSIGYNYLFYKPEKKQIE